MNLKLFSIQSLESISTCQPSLARRKSVLSPQFTRSQNNQMKPIRRASEMFLSEDFMGNTPPNSPVKSESMEIPSIPRYASHLTPLQGYFSQLSTSVENKSMKGMLSLNLFVLNIRYSYECLTFERFQI